MYGQRITRHDLTEKKIQINAHFKKEKEKKQVTKMKYLGIILDHKFRFNEHIKYTAERCGKLIHSLARVARMTWGIKYAAMDTIYKGAIIPLLTYGAAVWIEAMNHEYNR